MVFKVLVHFIYFKYFFLDLFEFIMMMMMIIIIIISIILFFFCLVL